MGANVAHLDRRRDERGIARVAGQQHGVISRRQLVALGFGRGAIERRLVTRRLHPIHLGIYAVGHCRLSLLGRWMAAVLACGPDALLSHKSAAGLWDLLPAKGSRIEVTAPRGRRGRSEFRVHRPRQLHPDDRATRSGIPVTTVARTLLDLAEVLRPRELERAVDQAERLELFDLRAIDALRERSHGRHGLAALEAVLSEYGGPAPTRSELERSFVNLCRKANLPPPAINSLIAGFEVDAAWHDERVAVELDSYGFHRTRQAFERDRARDGVLQLEGYRVLRLTHRRLEKEEAEVVSTLRSLLQCS